MPTAVSGLRTLVAEEDQLRTISLRELSISVETTPNGNSGDILPTGEDILLRPDVSPRAVGALGELPGFQYRYSFLTCARTFAM